MGRDPTGGFAQGSDADAVSSFGYFGRRRLKMGMSEYDPGAADVRPWNAGRKVGAKRAFKPKQVWAV